MRIFHSDKHTLYESCDFSGDAFLFHSVRSSSASPLPDTVAFPALYCDTEVYRLTRYFLRRTSFRRLLKAYEHSVQQDRYIVLKAHGRSTRRGEWSFRDGRRYYDMQHWINKMDGTALALFLYACNRANASISATKSLVFHADRKFTLSDLHRGRVNVRVFVPGEGYAEQDRKRLRSLLQDLSHCVRPS